jgi:VWFA-related protein
VCAAAALAVCLASPAPSRAQKSQTVDSDLVELDVLVLDRNGQPVSGLELTDFQVKEDGHLVEVKTFAERSRDAEGSAPRYLVLMLDDSSVPMSGTSVVQGMAARFVTRKTPSDEVTVVRLNNDRDEPFGDLETAVSRIAGYHAGAVPFQNRGTAERALKVIGSISRQLEAVEHTRKLIVCVGGPRVCNVLEPEPHGYSPNWTGWVSALAAAARANVAVYAAMPLPIGTPMMLTGGIAELTGGDGFANASNFEAFVDRVWREAGSYYLLGYWPASTRELHSIDVKTSRRGLQVRARKRRG